MKSLITALSKTIWKLTKVAFWMSLIFFIIILFFKGFIKESLIIIVAIIAIKVFINTFKRQIREKQKLQNEE